MTEALEMAQGGLLPNSIRLALSEMFHNKTNLATEKRWSKRKQEQNTDWAFGYTFVSQDVTPDALLKHIISGKAITMGSYAGVNRKKETFVSGQVMGLDLDQNISVDDCLAVDFIRDYAFLIYPTPSSGKTDDDGNVIYKSRVLFILDAPITDRVAWERMQRALIWHCSTLSPDPSCKDAARLFYGSETSDYFTQNAVLPVADIEPLVTAMETEIGTAELERSTEDNERIREQNRRNLADDKAKQRLYNYAVKALDNMVSSLSSLAEGGGQYGGRNNTLNIYAAKAGNLIAADMISHSECESALRGAALSCGLSSGEIDGTLQGGIAYGMNTPTDTDALEKQWAQKVADWKRQQQAKTIDIKQVYEQAKAALPTPQPVEPVTDEDVHDFLSVIDSSKLEQAAREYKAWRNGKRMTWGAHWKGIPYKTNEIELPKNVPFAHVSALLNLTNTRSATALVLGQMHVAFVTGKLSHAIFSVQDVADATGLDRRMIKKAFVDLERGGYVQFLKRESLYNIVSIVQEEPLLESAYTPAKYYVINTDLQNITANVLDMLTRFYTEKYAAKGLAKPTREQAEQIGVESYAVFKKWLARYETAKDDLFTKEAATRIRQEFEGDGHYWHGWNHALQSTFTLDIDWSQCETIKDVRGQILLQWVKLRDCNTQDELCRIAGCTEATLASVFQENNIATIAQTEKVEIKADFEDLRDVTRQEQRKKRGMIWEVKFKWTEADAWDKKWRTVETAKAALVYAQNSEKIESVLLLINKPSVQKPMTPEEIELVQELRAVLKQVKVVTHKLELAPEDKHIIRNARKVARQAKLKDIPHSIDMLNIVIQQYADTETTIESTPAPRKQDNEVTERKAPLTVKSHNWQAHRLVFQHRQRALETFMYTPYEVIGGAVFDKDKTLVFDFQYDLAVLVEWLNEHAAPKPIRSSAEFHGIEIEDYTPEIRAELKKRHDRKMKAIEGIDTEPTEDKIIQVLLVTKPELDERTKLFLEFCDRRWEREHKSKERMVFKTLANESAVDLAS